MSRRRVYIAHPLGSAPDREQNRRNAAGWCAWAATLGYAPVADWIVLSGVLEETEHNRNLGLECDFALIAVCDELWLVGGRVSAGMALEAECAKRHGVTVRDLTDKGYWAPFNVTRKAGG